MKQECY